MQGCCCEGIQIERPNGLAASRAGAGPVVLAMASTNSLLRRCTGAAGGATDGMPLPLPLTCACLCLTPPPAFSRRAGHAHHCRAPAPPLRQGHLPGQG